jgi:SAM-dependent methyltransferase
MRSRDEVTAEVRTFYDEMPFNASHPRDAARRIAAVDQVRAYPDLAAVLDQRSTARVLDLGCGTGWFALSLAYHRGLAVTAVDLSSKALAIGCATAERLGVSTLVRFVEDDLFDLLAAPSDVVNSLGVLHHTHDIGDALEAASAFVAPGGYLHLGLYHAHGRRPFLSLFAPWLQRGDTASARAHYRELNRGINDELLLESWFRDQLLHPRECPVTLAAIDGVLDPLGFDLCSSSLSGFAPVSSRDALFASEAGQALLSRRRNIEEGRFFPGFFTALYRRCQA